MITPTSRDDDAGLGLIELIVAVVVSGIVIVAMGMIFLNSWRAQEQVVGSTEATNRGQVVASMIERAMRNALYFEVSGAGDVLKVRTSLSAGLRCQAFQFTEAPAPDFGAVNLGTGASALPTVLFPWKSGIAKQGSAPYFERTADGTLTYTFVIASDASPVSFVGDVAPRSTQETESGGCWP